MKADPYDDLSRAELVRLLRRRGKEPRQRFGLVWERDEPEHGAQGLWATADGDARE